MLTTSIALPSALLPLLLIIINSPPAADSGNPYGVPPPRPQPQWQRPASQWEANGGRQIWAAQRQQQQYPQYPQYRAPVVAVPNPPVSGQGCYTFPRCPPILSTAAAEPTSTTSMTTSTKSITTIDDGGPGTATTIVTQTPIASSTTETILQTSSSSAQTQSTTAMERSSTSASSSSMTTTTSSTTSTTRSTTTSTTSTTTTPTTTTAFPTTTTVEAGTCNSTTPANVSVIFLEDASNATSYNRNLTPYRGNCTCPQASASGLTKEFYSSQIGPETIWPQAIRFECGGANDYTNLCICAEGGECFRQRDTIRLVQMKAYCNAGGECHSYIDLIRGALLGDRGTVFLASQQTGQLGPNSPYLKAVSASCLGCAKLQQAVLC